jgi:hypothetical protein
VEEVNAVLRQCERRLHFSLRNLREACPTEDFPCAGGDGLTDCLRAATERSHAPGNTPGNIRIPA